MEQDSRHCDLMLSDQDLFSHLELLQQGRKLLSGFRRVNGKHQTAIA